MDAIWKKAIAAAIAACLLVAAGYYFGRNSVHGERVADGDLDEGFVQTQEQQRDVAKSIDRAAGKVDAAVGTAKRIADSNDRSASIAAESGDIIGELQSLLDKIRETKQEN